jgi:hypothetical protein
MSITIEKHRYQLGRFILVSSGLLIILVFIYRFLHGFTEEEFTTLMTLLAPIKAVYLSALVKYIVSNPTGEVQDKDKQVLSKLYVTTSRGIIYTHMLSLIVLITGFAFFRFIEFKSLIGLVSGIETAFGVYVGLFLTNLFQEFKKEEKTDKETE